MQGLQGDRERGMVGGLRGMYCSALMLSRSIKLLEHAALEVGIGSN